MRILFEYNENEMMESADDLFCLKIDDMTRKFIKWVYYLEDNINQARLALKCLALIDNKYINNVFVSSIMISLTQTIVMSFSRIIDYKSINETGINNFNNKYSLRGFLNYCENVVLNIENEIENFMFDYKKIKTLEDIFSKVEDFYYKNIKKIRDKLYSHSDPFYYNEMDLRKYFSIQLIEIDIQIDTLINILQQVWRMFRGKLLSFEIKNENEHMIEFMNIF